MDGKVSPGLDSTVEPKMKVIIDTVPPSVVLEPDRRRGSVASVRWEVQDEYLSLRSMVLEYQIEGVGVWNQVPIARPKLIGSRTWDAGTVDALRVKMSVADKAGNVTEAVLRLPEGTGSPPEAVSGSSEDTGPPIIEPISGPGPAPPRITAGQGFTPVDDEPPPSRPPSAPARAATQRTGPAAAPAERRGEGSGAPVASRLGSRPRPAARRAGAGDRRRLGIRVGPLHGGQPPGIRGRIRGRRDVPPASPAAARPPAAAAAPGPGGAGAANTLLVDNPKFKLQYAIDDAGPNGPATVELWITQDGGRTWIRRGDDPDRVSPIEVDLAGEGTYGISLVARSASGLGDQPPAPGDPPQTWVEVDATAPAVQLDPVQVGTGANSGKVAIIWRATDLHLAPKSVSLFWRPDQPGAAWQPLAEGQENNGRYIWAVPTTVPTRFHVRVEASDTVGHRGSAETTDSGPIIVDRSRPRSRIIGLDPNARSGMGPSAWPLR